MRALQPTEVLSTLETAGLRLSLTPDLGIRAAPASCLNDALRAVIREFKPMLVEHLQRLAANDERGASAGWASSEADQELIDERAAIMEFDGCFFREHAERMSIAHTKYLLHHWVCKHCCAAGQGRGNRCNTGVTLWDAYNQAVL